jgi:hypothetical protein
VNLPALRLEHEPCPDEGACHHACITACFRVLVCGPLTGVFPGDQWPAALKERHLNSTAPMYGSPEMPRLPGGRTSGACPDVGCRHVGCWLTPEQLAARFDFDIIERAPQPDGPWIDDPAVWARATVIEHESE